MGINGSGKSTLASALMGYPGYDIISGTCRFEGIDVLEMPIERRARAGIFLAPQYSPAIPGVKVLTFLKEAHRMISQEDVSVTAFKDRVYEAFDAVQLDHSFVYRNVHEGFSGGEKKRFEVAQLILFKPKLAILDEIDSGLDVDALRTLSQVLERERQSRPCALLVITHYRRLLEHLVPDYVHVLSQGTLWASGDYALACDIDRHGYENIPSTGREKVI